MRSTLLRSLLRSSAAALLALVPLACGEKEPTQSNALLGSGNDTTGNTNSGKPPAAGSAQGLVQSGQNTLQQVQETADKLGEAADTIGNAPETLQQAQQQANDIVQQAQDSLHSLQGAVEGAKPSPGNRNGQRDVVGQAQDAVNNAQDTVQGALDGLAGAGAGADTAPMTELKPVNLNFAPDGPVKDENLDNFVVEMEVAIDGKTVGPMTFEFWAEKPITVRNFLRHASEGFYNGLSFHRIIKGFMIQGGCPLGTGTGQGKYGQIKGEFSREPKFNHVYGVLSMARSQSPDSASCQFFVCNAPAASLDGKYASFGAIIGGKWVLDKVSEVPVSVGPSGENSKPNQKVTITKATVYRKKEWLAWRDQQKAEKDKAVQNPGGGGQ